MLNKGILSQSELSRKYMYANFFSLDAYRNYISARLLIVYANNNFNSFHFMWQSGSTLMALASEQLIKSIFYLKNPGTKIRGHLLLLKYIELEKSYDTSSVSVKLGVKMYVLWQIKYSQDYNMNDDNHLKKSLEGTVFNINDFYGVAGHLSLNEFDSLMYELFLILKKSFEEVGYNKDSFCGLSIFVIKKDDKDLLSLLLTSNCKKQEYLKLLDIE